jgi:predicted lipoprotein with Yx(FWY)xxD motif
MNFRNLFSLIAGAAMLLATGTAMSADPVKTQGGMFVNATGMTLYTFDKDTEGKSVCNGPCAANWPPLMASASDKPAGNWTIITRDDGGKQWAYKGKALYTWVKDQKPGDTTGDGVGKVWNIAKP